MDSIIALTKDIIKGIVNLPEQVETYITEETDEKGAVTVINVKVAQKDVGVCIGSEGKNAEAIRKVVGLIGFKLIGNRVFVNIDAPKKPRYGSEV